jgi:pSer/pThr/pTyr-binding forkhead associated (FHA) protein
MHGIFLVIEGRDKGCTYPIPQGKTIQIGRGRLTPVNLDDPQVSRVHCQVHLAGTNALLTDVSSAGGTWVNGERVTQRLLQPGDIVRIGETQLSFRWSDADEQPTEKWESGGDTQ